MDRRSLGAWNFSAYRHNLSRVCKDKVHASTSTVGAEKPA